MPFPPSDSAEHQSGRSHWNKLLEMLRLYCGDLFQKLGTFPVSLLELKSLFHASLSVKVISKKIEGEVVDSQGTHHGKVVEDTVAVWDVSCKVVVGQRAFGLSVRTTFTNENSHSEGRRKKKGRGDVITQ